MVDVADNDSGEEDLRERGSSGLDGGDHRAAVKVNDGGGDEERSNTKCGNNYQDPDKLFC